MRPYLIGREPNKLLLKTMSHIYLAPTFCTGKNSWHLTLLIPPKKASRVDFLCISNSEIKWNSTNLMLISAQLEDEKCSIIIKCDY